MNDIQRGLLTIIQCAITNKAGVLPDGFSLEKAEKLIMRHQVVGIAYEGALLCGISKSEPVMQRMFQSYYQYIILDEKQQSALKKLFQAFEENGFDYLPVKGLDMKKLYPNPAMRPMGDADILIRMEQYDRIQQIMEELGYSFDHEYYHELAWKTEQFTVELHKSLIPETSKDIYAHFKDGWHLAKQSSEGSTRYDLPHEEFYLHIFTHLTKHYRGSGVGIKHMLDLWVYRRAYPDMDQGYINSALEKMGLLQFHNNILDTLDAWFQEKAATAITDHITTFIFSSGVFGTKENAKITAVLKDEKANQSAATRKIRRITKKMFPSYHKMARTYLVLRKMPILLPFMWVVRWFDVLFFRKKNIKAVWQADKLSDTETDKKRMYEIVGLDFSQCDNPE